jgi:hypothetical protein
MKVEHCEIRKGSLNPRTRRMTGLNGCIITFNTSEKISDGDYLWVTYPKGKQSFQVKEISTIDKFVVEVAALEVGYFAANISGKDYFDVRELIGCEVKKISDQSVIDKIIEQSCWC